ncbi:very-long-chain (3R)-3-hydroxyacyl-CoA dehydratase hpo-8-like [Panonychus citri]|uniref:very-long-chain (3R)-3-hydroxyacyl-CoA dehydratase hpo-8-like n=1 Tax=Panonychus citri TaxID=50023 RepID=UPI0023077F94|nr:very-long-chain (3R)-3-hydroxyacyl-CoA dehydratase hpo-8-like [Panonychus citri]
MSTKRGGLASYKIVKLYLILYNVAQFIGWGMVLYGLVNGVTNGSSNKKLYQEVRLPLLFFQTLQLIEVIHAAIKLVPSSPVTTFLQIISRIVVCWCIVEPIPQTRSSIGLKLILGAWGLAETTRYLYYALNIISLVPGILTWCRYSFFLVLYPTGVSGELLLMYAALPYIKKQELLFYKLPNPLNISFYSDYAVMAFMASYIPFFPKLYFYMVAQRNKTLSKSSSSKKSN